MSNKYKVIKNSGIHSFEIGTIVEKLEDFYWDSSDDFPQIFYYKRVNGKLCQWLKDYEVEKINGEF